MPSERNTVGISQLDRARSATEADRDVRPASSPGTSRLDEAYRTEFESLHDILCRLKHHRLLPEEAQEALQNAFVVLSERQGRDGFWPNDVRSWLIRVAVIQGRRLNRHRLVSLDAARSSNDLSAGPWAAALSDPDSSGPSTVLLEGERLAVTREALELLPEEPRRIIEAHVLEGKTFAVIARDRGLTEENAKKLCQRGLVRIRERLGRYSSSNVGRANAGTYKPRTTKGVLEAIHTLPRPYAEALEARYSFGLSFDQCAVIEEISLSAAEDRLRRAEELMDLKYGMTPKEILVAFRRPA